MTLCVCGHLEKVHYQFDDGEKCMKCFCQEYRKAADVSQSTASLSAGGSPEGLAPETIAESVNRPAVNEAAERLLRYICHRSRPTELLAAALVTERRNTVERIRARTMARWDDRGGHLTMAGLRAILDEVAS